LLALRLEVYRRVKVLISCSIYCIELKAMPGVFIAMPAFIANDWLWLIDNRNLQDSAYDHTDYTHFTDGLIVN